MSARLLDIIYKMLRLRTALLILLFIAIADASSKVSLNHYDPRLILVLSIMAAWYIFSTSTNDLADEAIDKINLKDNRERPLANNEIDRGYLWKVAGGSGIAALLLSSLLGPYALILTISCLGLSYIYSFPPIRVSSRGIFAPLLLPLGYVLFPFLLTVLANTSHLKNIDLILLAGLYIGFSGRIILKDFRDVKGDRKYGKRTFIVRYGAAATCWFSAIAWAISSCLIVLRFSDWPLLFITLVPFISGVFYFLRQLSHESNLERQIRFVGLIGRLSNSAALLVLTALYFELEPAKDITYSLLIIGVACFNLMAAYDLYSRLLRPRS